jgi:hypothetical protein
MKFTSSANLPVFFANELPNMASHCPQSECGFSIYKGILVQWDEDQDERVLTLIDEIPDSIRSQLLVVQEHKASIGFVWSHRIPSGYEEGQEFSVDEDMWYVMDSIAPLK